VTDITGSVVIKNCCKKVSIRKGFWFHGHNLTLEQIRCITYFWIYKVDQEFVKHELSINNQTIVDWYNYCREVRFNSGKRQ